MQVNTRAAHDTQVGAMASLQRQLDTLQGQIATGKRIAVPSDDPVASGIATRLRRLQAADTARTGAVDAAASRLAAADTALGSVATLLSRAREIGLQGANATLNAEDRATLAAETVQLGEQLLDLGNSLGPDGMPLFGGANGGGPAFARDVAGKVAWTGAGGGAAVALGQPVAAGSGDALAFTGPAGDAFALLVDLQLALAAPDETRAALLATNLAGLDAAVSRAADAQAGVGVRAARLDAEHERLTTSNIAREGDLTKVESLDMATAIARLQRLSTVLQAAQASFVKLTSLSLWDRL